MPAHRLFRILVVNQSEVRGGVDGEVAVRGGGFGTEHSDSILVVNEVVNDKPVGVVPFHQGVAQACVAVVAVGVGYELADSDCHRARGPIASPSAVLIDNGAVFAERMDVVVAVGTARGRGMLLALCEVAVDAHHTREEALARAGH